MFKRLTVVAILAAILLAVFSFSSAQDQAQLGPITQRIIDRGNLICGVHTGLAGFGFVNDAGEYQGFDVDICRAVAAALLGDASKVEYVPLNADQRQAAIQSEHASFEGSWGVRYG
jgi:general L-amino acid transport system substrate-binding protein